MEHDCAGMRFGFHLQDLQLATDLEIRGIGGEETIDEAVGLLGVRESSPRFSACVFDQDEASPVVGLHAFVSGAPDNAGNIFNLGGNVQRGLQNAGAGTALRGEEKVMRKWIPG